MQPYMEKLASSLIYQLFLRAFTPEGTLKGAEKMLPHLKDLGVDLIYLTPVTEADDDMDPRFWSRRTLECGFENPRNPYRVKDYYRIDPEYGTAQDLKDFVRAAHALGMGVLLDVVYIHCGPGNALRTEHPEFFITVEQSDWPFPRFDLANPAVRAYFADNLVYYLREFAVDGFRADCGDLIPCDFWQEVIGRVREEKPDAILLNEGSDPAHLAAGFDIDYGTTYCAPLRWLAKGDITAKWLAQHFREVDERTPPDKLGWRGLENHDFVNDAMDNRLEKEIGAPLMECALALNFTGRGVPYLYCGHEIGDTTRHSILANRFCAPNLRVNWSFARTEMGEKRMALIRQLAGLRHRLPVLSRGEAVYPAHEKEDEVLVCFRRGETDRVCVAVNLTNAPQSLRLPITFGEELFARGASAEADCASLEPYGILIARYEEKEHENV